MTEQEVLEEAAAAFREADELQRKQVEMDVRLRNLCRDWGETARVWGVAPYHLRKACIMHGLL